ncbi:MAG: hypothetical protein LGR52_09030 [Candidatus Thiosymbion ectosymbiont of Robbea hypermnestra]|nr:hypothetical protein [Candidatus Thiosymbion ectosymbiont of Robbea hypermnestra]
MIDTERTLANSAALTIHFEGLDQDGGDVDFASLLNDLNTIRRLLNASDEIVSGERRPTSHYLVSGLSNESPAAITLTAEPRDQAKDFSVQTVEYLISGFGSIRDDGIIPVDATNAFLDNAANLINGLGNRFKRIWLQTDKNRMAAIDKKLSDAIDDLIGSAIVSWGAIKGVVERFNSHSQPCTFNIYPASGPQDVRCVFDRRSMMDKAIAAVNHTVTVTGELKYRPRHFTPYECSVARIDIHPPDDELPKLGELYGINPNVTGELETLEFIRRIRNEWQ